MAKPSTPPEGSGPTSVPVPTATLGAPIAYALYRVARLHRMIAGNLLRRVGLHPTQEVLMMYLWNWVPSARPTSSAYSTPTRPR